MRKFPKYHVDQSKGAIPSGPFRLELFIEGMGLVMNTNQKNRNNHNCMSEAG
jgi:hypothetical protein